MWIVKSASQPAENRLKPDYKPTILSSGPLNFRSDMCHSIVAGGGNLVLINIVLSDSKPTTILPFFLSPEGESNTAIINLHTLERLETLSGF